VSEGTNPTTRSSGAVESSDGTTIGYYTLGQGPGVVLVHGAGQWSDNFRSLAESLSDAFTVYVPDRRGRGMSGPYGEFDGLRTEIDDLSALLDATGAHFVFGLSSGAIIALETAVVRPDITKLALYEPPLSFDGVTHGSWVPRYERELGAGNLGGALITVLKATADRGIVRYVPRFLLVAPLNFVLKRTANRPPPAGELSPRELIPTLHYDAQSVRDAAGPLERFAGLHCEILLLGGTKSAADLTASLDGLSRVLPRAKRVTLRGVGHTAADNRRQPAVVGAALRAFFA